MKEQKLYQCVGENFTDICPNGYCGDVHSLNQWLYILIKNQSKEYIDEYFDGTKDTEKINYIYNIFKKRLKKI